MAQLPVPIDGAVFVGAAGLAEALAERLFGAVNPGRIALDRPALFAIGSRDPVTIAQVDALRTATVIEAVNGACPSIPVAPVLVLRMTEGDARVSSTVASTTFAETLHRAIEAIRPATLLACGGESAASLLEREGVGQLDLLGEVLPGVPAARCVDGPQAFRNLTFLTKSGGFGPPDTLVKLVNLLASSGGEAQRGTDRR